MSGIAGSVIGMIKNLGDQLLGWDEDMKLRRRWQTLFNFADSTFNVKNYDKQIASVFSKSNMRKIKKVPSFNSPDRKEQLAKLDRNWKAVRQHLGLTKEK